MIDVSDNIVAFINERYDRDGDDLRCKRCGELVDWVTKHAAERHGDDIEVMPSLGHTPNPRW